MTAGTDAMVGTGDAAGMAGTAAETADRHAVTGITSGEAETGVEGMTGVTGKVGTKLIA